MTPRYPGLDDLPAETREYLVECGHQEGLRAAFEALHALGMHDASRVVLDLKHARRLSAFVLRNEALGAPRPPQLGVAHEATTPAGVGSNA